MFDVKDIIIILLPMICQKIIEPFDIVFPKQIMLIVVLYILTYLFIYFNNSNKKIEINKDKEKYRKEVNKKVIITMIPFFVWILMYVYPTTSNFMNKYGMSIVVMVIFTILYYYSYKKLV